MRWRFADPNNDSEMKYRRETIEKIDTFWRAFEEIMATIPTPVPGKTVRLLASEISQVSKDLMWELSPVVNGDRRFVITPESNFYLHPLVQSMLERAPEIPGLRFMPHREPVEPDAVANVAAARLGRWLPDLRISAKVAKGNTIDLNFVSKKFQWQDNPFDRTYCSALSAILFGQRIEEEWIGEIRTLPAKAGFLSRIQSRFSKHTPEAFPAEPFSVAECRVQIEEMHQGILAKLPSQPMWRTEPAIGQRKGGAAIEFKQSSAHRKTGATYAHQIIMGALPPPSCFNSERFSRCGETFCYLKIDESASKVTEHSPDRDEIEEAFDIALRKASAGCVTGGGWGPVFNFIDFALADVDLAIPILRQVSLDLKLPKAAWLRFLDTKLFHEWVGMYDDSPQPEITLDW